MTAPVRRRPKKGDPSAQTHIRPIPPPTETEPLQLGLRLDPALSDALDRVIDLLAADPEILVSRWTRASAARFLLSEAISRRLRGAAQKPP